MAVVEMIQAKPTPQGIDEETEAQRGSGATWDPPAWAGFLHVSLLELGFQGQQALAFKVQSTDAGGAWIPSSKASPLP